MTETRRVLIPNTAWVEVSSALTGTLVQLVSAGAVRVNVGQSLPDPTEAAGIVLSTEGQHIALGGLVEGDKVYCTCINTDSETVVVIDQPAAPEGPPPLE